MSKIFEALIDPRINIAPVDFDGVSHVMVEIVHPRHGSIHMLVPIDVAQQVSSLLMAAADEVAKRRLK